MANKSTTAVTPPAVQPGVSPAATAKPMNPLLASYLASLATRPLLTKCCTSATLSFFQEILASRIAGVRPTVKRTGFPPLDALQRAGIDTKVLKLAAYGFFISAPLGHALMGILQRAFAGRTGARAKIGQIIASNVFVAPIQNSAFLIAMAVINGAKTTSQVTAVWKRSFLYVMRLSWIIGPLSMAVAQKYIDPAGWVPFFSFVSFVAGTVINTKAKKAQLAIAKAKRDAEKSEKRA